MGRTAWLRRAALGSGAALLGFALLCAYAAPRLGVPWKGKDATALPAAAFQGGTAEGDALRVERPAGAPQHVLAYAPPVPLQGRFLSYRFDPLPGELRLLLGWRTTAGAPWAWKPLPQADGRVTVDLARLSEQWSGEAAALAFLLLPAELLAPGSVPAHRLRFHGAVLEADGRAAAIAALLDEWRAYSPWSGRSINTAGFDLGMDAPRPFQGFVLAVLLLGSVVLAAWWALRRRRPRFAPTLLLALAVGWLLLDLAQLGLLAQRTGQLADLAKLASAESTSGGLAIHPALARALAEVRRHPALARPGRRIVVLAPDSFRRTWPVFELLPLDAAAILPSQLRQLPAGMLVLRLGGGGYAPGSGLLRAEGVVVRVRELHADDQLQLLEVLAPAEVRP